jgi:hypothetical protein
MINKEYNQENDIYVKKLIDIISIIIDSIKYNSLINSDNLKIVKTQDFCSILLKKSKSTYYNILISLFYIFRIKTIFNKKKDNLDLCNRRLFLGSLIITQKYMNDNYINNNTWSKITSLDIKEINKIEIAFLELINYNLYIKKSSFDNWVSVINNKIYIN